MSEIFTREQERRIREVAEVVPLHMRPTPPRNETDQVVRLTRWVAILCTVTAIANVAMLATRVFGA